MPVCICSSYFCRMKPTCNFHVHNKCNRSSVKVGITGRGWSEYPPSANFRQTLERSTALFAKFHSKRLHIYIQPNKENGQYSKITLSCFTYTVLCMKYISIVIQAIMMVHYGDVIMGSITSQTTSLTIVYSIVYSDAHQSSASLGFVREFTGDRWIPRTNGQ